jgi:predicted nucleic acid-binding Zn ribbon protein
VRRDLAPATTLARVQEVWPAVGGPAAREASPVSERGGTVTFECRSSVWAGELSLMSRELVGRLNGALGGSGEAGPVSSLRFVTGASRSGS